MRAFASTILLAVFANNVKIAVSHGGMYYPWTWTASNTKDPAEGPQGHKFKTEIPIPEEHCVKETAVNPLGCKFRVGGGIADWYTNYTRIPGEPTIPDDMQDEFSKPTKKNPWAAPGTAMIFGEGCGVNGGNPDGCGWGNVYGNCCGRTCGGYEGGKAAVEYAKDGLFDNAPLLQWEMGQPAEVFWLQQAEHRGGYAYRLCKVPESGISGVTEACFSEGHLDFYGNTTWIWYRLNSKQKWSEPVAMDAVRTRDGTYPPGSEWAKITLPLPPKNKQQWAFKDMVQVPEDIEPGMYVLSFRWDCQNTPQIWSSCANIEILPPTK